MIKYDRELDLATGTSRKTKTWKNKRIPWSTLLERLANVTRTPETVAEYARMSRERQSEIKDVGGFVGGYCTGGNRTNVAHRSMLTLDADFADMGLWEDYGMIYGNAAAIYSTHKHKPDAARLRLVIPLDRDVTPDEYQAISRRVAADLGIEKFDDTTYQPQRLMYWPSCSYDGEYVFESIDGPFMVADEILATYHDWHDMSAWPMSNRVAEISKARKDKQQDPTEKEGLIGVFCRTYTIQEAIEKWVPEYEPSTDGRYTYLLGSTASGVVIYDDKFSYSHHSTDPAGGQLCNAWDLVRIQNFHDLDSKADEDTPVSKLPSYQAMTKLALEDDAVKIASIRERAEQVADDFDVIPEEDTKKEQEEPENWELDLKLTDKGAIASTIDNVVIILEHDPGIAAALAINDFQHTMVVTKDLPWRKIRGKEEIWTDTDDAMLRHYLETKYNLRGKDRIFDGCNVAAQHRRFHPVRDYLNSCQWDGVPRVEELLIRYLGAEDTPYTRKVTRMHMAAAVARIMRPGVKYDTVLTIKGGQGIGKSTLISRLGGEWSSDSFTTVQGKEAYEQVQGVWIIEIGELAGLKKAEVEATKLFVSKQEDRFRPAYGRRIESFPRQCVFWATTNEQQFLRDTTGNRRWIVVEASGRPVGNVWDELTPDLVKMIWAEALTIYESGEPLYLDAEMEAVARKIQSEYVEETAQAGLVEEYLERLLPDGWDDMDTWERREWLRSESEGTEKRQTVSHVEIWAEALGQDPNRLDRYGIKELQDIMQQIPGWRYSGADKKRVKPYGVQRYYRRTKE